MRPVAQNLRRVTRHLPQTDALSVGNGAKQCVRLCLFGGLGSFPGRYGELCPGKAGGRRTSRPDILESLSVALEPANPRVSAAGRSICVCDYGRLRLWVSLCWAFYWVLWRCCQAFSLHQPVRLWGQRELWQLFAETPRCGSCTLAFSEAKVGGPCARDGLHRDVGNSVRGKG